MRNFADANVIDMQKEETILEVNKECFLMQFLLDCLPRKNRDNIKSLLRNKQVWIDGKAVSQFNHILKPGNAVIIKQGKLRDLPPENRLRIVYEDHDLIIIDKKAGLLSVSDGNDHLSAYKLLSDYVKGQNPANRIFIVHRLDRFTSGLMMFAKTEPAQNILRNDWKSYITERTYTAVVEGEVRKTEGTISSYLTENREQVVHSGDDPSKGKLAVSHYRVLKTGRIYSLVALQLDTGRKNQIRVHMQDIGHPVAGDKKYGAKTDPTGRVCLHATVLAFKHPITGDLHRFESKIPGGFLKLFSLNSLKV
jgi:23S rRNA pseudouridine1911/1915/1917 synthase